MSRFLSISDWRLDAISKTGPVKAAWNDSIKLSRTKGGLSHLAGLTVFITIQKKRTQACVPIKYQLPITSAQLSASVFFEGCLDLEVQGKPTVHRSKDYNLLPITFNISLLFLRICRSSSDVEYGLST